MKIHVSRKMGTSIFTSVRKDKLFWIALIFCIIVLGFTIFFRQVFVDGLLIGCDSYYNLRMAASPLVNYDSLAFENQPVFGERAWFLLISLAPTIFSWFLPFLLGLLSFALFYIIMKKIRGELRFIASILLVISPAFVYLFSTSNKYAAAILFCLLAVYLFLRKKYNLMIVALVVSALFSFVIGFIALLALLFKRSYWRKLKRQIFVYFLILLALFSLYYYSFIFTGLQFFYPFEFGFLEIVTRLFTDFGAFTGFAIFMILLSIFGIYHVYPYEYKYLAIIFIFVFCFIAAIYSLSILFLLNLLVVYFAAVGLLYFYNYEWRFDLIKSIMMIVLICGLLFSFLSYYEKLLTSHPSDSMRRAMATISYEPGNVVVISSIENADFINYAGAKTLVDPRGSYLPGFEKRVDDINKLYHYTHVEDITSFMKRYNETYLWIDKNMLDQI